MPRVGYTKNGEIVFVTEDTGLPITQTNAALTAFGELRTAELTKLVDLKFNYGLSDRTSITSINNAAGSVTTSEAMAVVSTGAATNSMTALVSRVPGIYEPGVGLLTRFTTLFATPKTGTNQQQGMGRPSDGFFIAYHDTTFGFDVVTSGAQHVHKFVFTTGSTDTSNITITLDGDAQTVATVSGDSVFAVARAVQAAASDFALLGDGWAVFSAGDTVEFVSFRAEPRAGAFTLGAGATGVVATLSNTLAGVTATVNTTTQANFNRDKLDGTGPSGMTFAAGASGGETQIDSTNLNVFAIPAQHLGAGDFGLYWENPLTGMFILVHLEPQAGNSIIPSVRNPSFPTCMVVENTTNNTDMVMKSASHALFLEGKKANRGVSHTARGAQTTITTEEMILALHVPPTFASSENRIISEPGILSLTTDGTKSVTFRVYRNPILGGSPVFVDVETGETPIQLSTTAGVTITSGTPILSFELAKVESKDFIIRGETDDWVQGDTFVVTAQSSVNTDPSTAITWKDFQ